MGGVVSPILANLYLDKLDKFVETVLIPEYTKGTKRKANKAYEKLMHRATYLSNKGQLQEAQRVRKQAQKLPSQVCDDPDYRSLDHRSTREGESSCSRDARVLGHSYRSDVDK